MVALLAICGGRCARVRRVAAAPRHRRSVRPATARSLPASAPRSWLANADGSDPHRLDIGLGQSISPVFSPDGTKLAFMTRVGAMTPYSLFVANADGTGARSVTGDMKVVTSELAGITWSPDGRTLIFASSDASKTACIGSAPTAALVALTDKQSNRAWPAWSPDGAWLAYQGKPTSEGSSLMISRPDGSGERTTGFDQGVQRVVRGCSVGGRFAADRVLPIGIRSARRRIRRSRGRGNGRLAAR